MRITSNERPQEVVLGRHLGQPQRTINFNISEETLDDFPQYTYNSVTLPPGTWTYEAIVSALVNEIYPYDRMSAIQNNLADEPDNPQVIIEHDQMQAWRRTAKAMAKRLLAE